MLGSEWVGKRSTLFASHKLTRFSPFVLHLLAGHHARSRLLGLPHNQNSCAVHVAFAYSYQSTSISQCLLLAHTRHTQLKMGGAKRVFKANVLTVVFLDQLVSATEASTASEPHHFLQKIASKHTAASLCRRHADFVIFSLFSAKFHLVFNRLSYLHYYLVYRALQGCFALLPINRDYFGLHFLSVLIPQRPKARNFDLRASTLGLIESDNLQN